MSYRLISLAFIVGLCSDQTPVHAESQTDSISPELSRIAALLDHGAVCHRTSRVPWDSTALKEGEWNTLFECDGPGMITHIWMTFPVLDVNFGRRNLLRMRWDEETDPSVEAPLGDFFGIPFGFTGIPAPELSHPQGDYFNRIFDFKGPRFEMNSHYLVVGPNNGLNSYFPMPFGKSAKIEIFPDQIHSGAGYYLQIDYVTFPEELPAKWRNLRFHAQFRREDPCKNYGNYVFLDAVGRGALVGLTLAIDANDDPIDFWPHGGGDTILIDGLADSPTVLHGIGTEDFFCQSWGVLGFNSPYFGTSYYEIKDNHPTVDPEQFERLSVYRFLVSDPIVFHHSIRGLMGCMANRYSSVAYWYQEEPHRRFYETPPADQRMPDTIAPAGTSDRETLGVSGWQLIGPFEMVTSEDFAGPGPIDQLLPPDPAHRYDPSGKRVKPDDGDAEDEKLVRWKADQSEHHFVNFKETCGLPLSGFGYAYRQIHREASGPVTFRVGFDDQIAIDVNGKQVFTKTHNNGFEIAEFKVDLKKGKNDVLVKLSNTANTTFKFWAFWLRFESTG